MQFDCEGALIFKNQKEFQWKNVRVFKEKYGMGAYAFSSNARDCIF